MKYKKLALGSFLLLILSTAASLMFLSFSPSPATELVILSGSKHATQYRFVEDIVNIVSPSLNLKLVNKESKGAADNFNELSDPKSPYKIAIMQADYLYFMQTQDMRLNEEKTKNLRVLLPLGTQQIHLITKADRGIVGLKDIAGRKVGVGTLDQGTYRTALLIKDHSKVDFIPINKPFEECYKALTVDEISAFFIVSSAPVEMLDLNPQAMSIKLALVHLDNVNDWARYHKQDTIRQSDYKWLDHDVPTFSVASVIVVNESKLTDAERNAVLELKSGIESKFEQLKANGHPEWKLVNLSEWSDSDWPQLK